MLPTKRAQRKGVKASKEVGRGCTTMPSGEKKTHMSMSRLFRLRKNSTELEDEKYRTNTSGQMSLMDL